MAENVFFMIFLEGGGAPVYKHETLDSAEKEAKRLVEKFERKAYILKSAKSIALPEKFIVSDLLDEEFPF